MANRVKTKERTPTNASKRRKQSRSTGQLTKPVARWIEESGEKRLVLENCFFRVQVCPERGGAIVSYQEKSEHFEIIWKNPYGQPPRTRLLDQPVAAGSDLYDVMDGSWYVSLPNGFFAGDYFGAPLGTHGELRTVPWTVEEIRSRARELVVTFRGASVRTPLVYWRELTLRADSTWLEWTETVENRCGEAMPIAWLQHPTFGGALLDGAKLLAPAEEVRVFNSDAPEAMQLKAGFVGAWPMVPEREGGALRDCSVVPRAESGIDHSVQLAKFRAGCGCIWNEQRKLGFALQWDLEMFPYAWSWANAGGIKRYPLWGEGHIMTLQPSTSPVGRFSDLLKAGQLRSVPARGKISTKMTTGFVKTAEGLWK